MTESTAVATTTEGQVPALRQDPSRQITGEDLQFPRLYVGQAISEAVQNDLVKAGDIFLASGQDDPEPQVLAKRGSEEGVSFSVLDLIKSKSRSIEGILETWAFTDPSAPSDAWTVYTYFVAIPGVEDDLPVRYLLTRTGKPAAQKINTVIARNVGAKPVYELGFRLTTVERNGDKGRYYVPRVNTVELTDEQIAVARNLHGLTSANADKVAEAAGDEPRI